MPHCPLSNGIPPSRRRLLYEGHCGRRALEGLRLRFGPRVIEGVLLHIRCRARLPRGMHSFYGSSGTLHWAHSLLRHHKYMQTGAGGLSIGGRGGG